MRQWELCFISLSPFQAQIYSMFLCNISFYIKTVAAAAEFRHFSIFLKYSETD